jgi:type I restriction enzyme S subunit
MRLRVGSGLPNIQKKDINKFQLDFPKLEEQINDALKLKLTNKEIEILKEVVEKYKEQKRGLMQKLLTGEWRVKV